jgi:hypothetical protein
VKKVGIVTFHCANNYGAVLQTYALQTAVSFFDYAQVHVVDYNPIEITAGYKVFSLHSFWDASHKFRYCAVVLFNARNRVVRRIRFGKTRRDFLNLDKSQIFSTYDVILCGSDQIWNPQLSKGFDPYYFGLLPGFHGIKASYAASLGLKNLTEYQKEELKGLLKNLDGVSVREKAMLPLFQPLVSIPISVCLDPTLLLGRNQWEQIIQIQTSKNYILIYQMIPDEQLIKDAYALASTTGFKVLELSYGKRIGHPVKHKVITTAGPIDFLGLFFHAEYVLTNSFHGTAFSILFNKQFCSYKPEQGSARITDLLDQLGVPQRYVHSSKDVIFSRIDWESVNARLAFLREESLNYIQSVLKMVKE